MSTPSSKRRRQRYPGVMGTPLHSPGDMLSYDLHIPPHHSSPVPMQGGGVSGLYSLHDDSAHQHHQTSPLVVTLQQQHHHQPHHQLLQQHMPALQPHLAQPQHLLMDSGAAGGHEPARQHGLVGRQVQVQVQVQQTMEADGGTLVFPQTFPGYPPLLLTGGGALRSPEHVDTPLRKATAEAKQL